MKISFLGITVTWGDTKCCKLCHSSEEEAKKMVARQARKGRTRYPYYCPDCKAWHTTKQPQRGLQP